MGAVPGVDAEGRHADIGTIDAPGSTAGNPQNRDGDAAGVDLLAAVAEVNGIVDDIGVGVPPRALTARILAAARSLSGGSAAVLAVAEGDGFRVAATTPSAAWIEGRRVALEGSVLARLFAGNHRTLVIDSTEAAPALRPDLHAHDCHRVMLSRVTTGLRPLGAIVVTWPEAGRVVSSLERAMVELCAGALGLTLLLRPEGATGPTGRVPAGTPDGLAIIASDGRVRAWTDAARELTGLAQSDVLGRPAPFPVPLPGQVREHRLPSGRWVELRCAVLDPSDRVVTFRDVTATRMHDQARDLFLATTSHELRTPLTAVRGYAETLATRWEDLDDTARREALDVIVTRSRELGDLIDRLLLGHREEGTSAPVTPGPFDLVSALREALALVAPSEAGHRLEVRLPDALPPALGDRESIPTIVTELVTNAYKYSPHGGTVEVTAGEAPASVWFRVADRGVGIDPAHTSAVFLRFWQAEQGDQRRFGGVGLGLYIIRRLLDRQDGSVTLRPRPGGGVQVEVRLPKVARESDPGSPDDRGLGTPWPGAAGARPTA